VADIEVAAMAQQELPHRPMRGEHAALFKRTDGVCFLFFFILSRQEKPRKHFRRRRPQAPSGSAPPADCNSLGIVGARVAAFPAQLQWTPSRSQSA